MSSVVISGDTSGAITLSAPAVAGTNTITLPAATGTAMVSGNQPAFGAWNSSVTSTGTSTYTKILFQTEEFDTNNNFSSSTFTPTVAGYYQFNATVTLASPVAGIVVTHLYKNGASFKRLAATTNSSSYGSNGSAIVYANGTTDYFEIYLYQNSGGSINTNADQPATYFNACLVRTA
jgi:hypothetical protein